MTPASAANRRSSVLTVFLAVVLGLFGVAESVGVASSVAPVSAQAAGSAPAPVAATPLTGVSALAAGGEHTCAVVAGGHVVCWGGRWEGDLGDETRTDSQVRCWGGNGSGALGNGQETVGRIGRTPEPTPTSVVPLAGDVIGLAGATSLAGRASAAR